MVAMMNVHTTLESVDAGEFVPLADHRVWMSNVSWNDFESFIAVRGEDAAGPRVAYLEGTLELMSPSADHESIKKCFAIVVEAYLDHLGVRYRGVGSWLLKHAASKVGLEPDECYLIGDVTKPRPDLALEVAWTSGGMDKLELYRRLGVPEVWIWKRNTVSFFVLTDDGYAQQPTSSYIPTFDPALLAEMLALETHSDVKRELRKRFG